MRQFEEFYSDDKGQAWLEVYCYALPQGEVEELIGLLEKKNFRFQSIQEDSLRARIEGNYEEVSQVVRDLMKEKFYWSEAGKEAEEKGDIRSGNV